MATIKANIPLDKGSMVLGVIQIFDIAENAIRESNELKRQLSDRQHFTGISSNEQTALGHFEAIMLKVGRETVYKDSTCRWRNVTATKDEDTGEVKVTPFEKWCKEKAYDIPSYFSYDEFCAYFAEELRADYESEKEKAIAKLAVEGEGDE